MNDTDTNTTDPTRAPGVPTELWNDKNRKLNDLLDELTTLSCVVEASGEVRCERSGSARITGTVVLDSRDGWADFTGILLDNWGLSVCGLSSNDKLVPASTTTNTREMERATHVNVSFIEQLS